MKRIAYVILLTSLFISILVASVHAADFGPIFPKQAAKMVAPPNFTWATGDYDFFILMVFAPIPGYWYQPIAIPQSKSYFLMPEGWWDALITDGWGLWFVLGMNTATGEYGLTTWQVFQKVTDCVVSFPDPNLENVIREAISKPAGKIMASDLVDLTILTANYESISDLRGLEYCANLTDFYLLRNPISEIESLAGLVKLQFLWLESDQISEIDALAGLTNLNALVLTYNQISDISPLAGLSDLWALYLEHNQISDISPLAGLMNLEGLSLSGNQVRDITPLAEFTNLQYAYLSGNQISDITCLAGLASLEELSLSDNKITDITPLALFPMNFLRYLWLEGNLIRDIYPLVQNTEFESLVEVHLRRNDLSSLSCTVYIPQLQSRGVWVDHDCFAGP